MGFWIQADALSAAPHLDPATVGDAIRTAVDRSPMVQSASGTMSLKPSSLQWNAYVSMLRNGAMRCFPAQITLFSLAELKFRLMVNVVATQSLTMSKPLFPQRTNAGLSDVVLNVWLWLKKMLEPSLRSSVRISDDVPFDVFGHDS